MTKTIRPQPLFIADDFGLDILNSVAAPWGEQIEWLGDGADLLVWLEQAGQIPQESASRLRENSLPKALDAVAVQARDLREWFREFVANHAGRPLKPSALADLDRLNRLIARGETYRQIELQIVDTLEAAQQTNEVRGSSLQWRRHRRWRTPEDLLLPIAEAMGDLICQANFERVKNCEGPKCTLWFHDTSKNHTRRWCMMAVCGNRAKAAAHRARVRSNQQDSRGFNS